MVLGVTEYIDHRETTQTDDRRLRSLWFGNGCAIKAQAYRVAKEKMEGWKN